MIQEQFKIEGGKLNGEAFWKGTERDGKSQVLYLWDRSAIV